MTRGKYLRSFLGAKERKGGTSGKISHVVAIERGGQSQPAIFSQKIIEAFQTFERLETPIGGEEDQERFFGYKLYLPMTAEEIKMVGQPSSLPKFTICKEGKGLAGPGKKKAYHINGRQGGIEGRVVRAVVTGGQRRVHYTKNQAKKSLKECDLRRRFSAGAPFVPKRHRN